jgi:hypothetical protein
MASGPSIDVLRLTKLADGDPALSVSNNFIFENLAKVLRAGGDLTHNERLARLRSILEHRGQWVVKTGPHADSYDFSKFTSTICGLTSQIFDVRLHEFVDALIVVTTIDENGAAHPVLRLHEMVADTLEDSI